MGNFIILKFTIKSGVDWLNPARQSGYSVRAELTHNNGKSTWAWYRPIQLIPL